jgi:hypothetical protein
VASLLIAIAAAVLTLAAALFLLWGGFRNGDWTGEALARSLRKDLEAAAADDDHIPPFTVPPFR